AVQGQLQVVFVTIDPARDTPAVVAQYAAAFHPSFMGVSGTAEQTASIAKAYKVYYSKGEGEGNDYAMNHSGFVYLMDKNGVFAKHWPHHVGVEVVAKDLEKLVQ
ncbi:MAG: SCO family protein, partial [Alphaproteobacteria bacterium]